MPRNADSEIAVFISHSHRDKNIAEALVNFLIAGVGLEPDDIRCTSHSPTGLAIGSLIANRLRDAIENCDYFLPLITPNTLSSEFVAFEIGAAWALETSLAPLVLESATTKIPALLQGLVYCDLKSLDALIQLVSELSQELFYAQDRRSPNQMLSAARTFLAATAV